MRTTAVAAGAIICSAVAAVPFVCGQILEREIREAMDGYKKRQSFVTASVVSYDRHFLRSEFVTRLAVRGGPSSFARPRACVTRLSPACTLPPAKATCISRKPMRQPSTTTSAAGHRLPSTSMSSSAAARAASCALPPSRSLSSRRPARVWSQVLRPGDSTSRRTRRFSSSGRCPRALTKIPSCPWPSTGLRCRHTASWATTICRSAPYSSCPSPRIAACKARKTLACATSRCRRR